MARNSLKNVRRLLELQTKEVPVEESFLADLKRSIELSDKKNSRKPSQTYKPSSMNCLRNMYYQVTGVEVENDSNYVMVGICQSGSDTHEYIQNKISEMSENGMNCKYVDVADFVTSRGLTDELDIVAKQGNETKLYHKRLNMSFLCDGIIDYKDHYYIVEFKTETAFKWQQRNGVDPKHYNQATAYSLAFGIDEVIFVYICRDNSDMKAYKLTVTSEMRDILTSRIEECDRWVNVMKKAPEIDKSQLPKNTCRYCAYGDVCAKDG